jgi:serine/threonine protein kinase
MDPAEQTLTLPPTDDRTERLEGSSKPEGPLGNSQQKTERVATPAAKPQPLGSTPPAIPGYTVVRKLGEGTYGQVWLFEEVRTSIQVAVKFFARGWGMDWLLLQAEVKQLAMLHADPGIVQLEDVEPDARPPYYIMNYAPGGSLAQRLEGGKGIPVDEALRLFKQITAALAYVHAKGIRHCDLKPGNILLDARGRALIGDFGQAHLGSDTSPALGTFFYMAPEQADLNHNIPDTRWDVYGLGALFYAMLTGGPPREEPTLLTNLSVSTTLASRLERYREAVRQAPRPRGHRKLPGMDSALAGIVDRCLEIDPQKRFHDAGAVLEALGRRSRARRRRPLLLFGLAAPLLLLALMSGLAYRNGRKPIQAAEAHSARQLQESDRVTARLVASVVQEHINDRIDFMEDFVDNHEMELQQIQNKAAAGPALHDLLKSLYHEGKLRKFFHQYSIADANGYIRAGYPLRTEKIKDAHGGQRRWAFRDWFNGQGDKPDQQGDFAPIQKFHVSQAYVSRVPDKAYLSVNVSVPLFEPARPDEERKVIGVLTGQIYIKDLHNWLDGVAISGGYVVLLNDHGQCLKHGVGEAKSVNGLKDLPDWREHCELYRQILSDQPGDGLASYEDPIAEKEYLAGYALFPEDKERPGVRWAALVQHDREVALQPIAHLEDNLRTNCLIALGLGALLVTGLWAWLVFTLRREERLAQG